MSSMSNPTMTIVEVLERSTSAKATTYTVIATVKGWSYHQLLYRACGRLLGAEKVCYLKVRRSVDGTWQCRTPTRVTWRFSGQVEMADATGSLWATCCEAAGGLFYTHWSSRDGN